MSTFNQASEIYSRICQGKCVLCNTAEHTTSVCDAIELVNFEIDIIEKIISIFTNTNTNTNLKSIIENYLHEQPYILLAGLSHSQMAMPVNLIEIPIDNYVWYILTFYVNILSERDGLFLLEQRLDFKRDIRRIHMYRGGLGRYLSNTAVIEVDTDVLSEEGGTNDWLSDGDEDVERVDIDILVGNTDDLLKEYNEADINSVKTCMECPICFTDMPLEKMVKLQCDNRHVYCSDCILSICKINPICSLCRKEITAITIYSDETFADVGPYLS